MKKEKDPKFLKWLKQFRCIECGAEGVDPHHLPSTQYTRRFKDRGNCVVLCRICHTYYHNHPAEERTKLAYWTIKAKEYATKYENE
jgi:hypothetical protein